MAIMTRISRLLVSDMHAVLERLEEPELVLKQSIREMEEALQAQRTRAHRGCAALRRMKRRAQELDARLAELSTQLDVSIAAGRMDTSRSIVRRKLETQSQAELLARNAAVLEEQVDDLHEGIARRSTELESLREKAQLVCESDEPAAAESLLHDTGTRSNEQDVEAALLREIERRRPS